MLRAAEGRLGVDDPVVTKQYPQPGGEGAWLRKVRQVAVELKLASMEGVAESSDELAAKDTAQYADGKKEGTPGGDPAGMVRGKAAGGNDAVDMGMKLQALIPAVEHAEESDLGSEVPRVGGWNQASPVDGSPGLRARRPGRLAGMPRFDRIGCRCHNEGL